MATMDFIKHNQFEDTLKLAEMFLDHKHHLMHKATGWMLREVGKKDRSVLEQFLKAHYTKMPRTMLRYSIEKFEPDVRQNILKGVY
jgi:3-methyladenine DNA glycosylase AlkD